MKREEVLLAGLACCLCCLFVPIALVVVESANNPTWETVQGTVAGTVSCSRRRLEATGYYIESIHNRKNPQPRGWTQPYYKVTYSFTTVDGEQLTATTDSCNRFNPPLGSTEAIRYNPDNPTVGVVSEEEYLEDNALSTLLIAAIVVGAIGSCAFGIMKFMMGKFNNNNNNS